jgi:iron(III) transport system substrate-binding protein
MSARRFHITTLATVAALTALAAAACSSSSPPSSSQSQPQAAAQQSSPAAAPAAQAGSSSSSLDALYQKARQEGTVLWDGQFSESQAAPILSAFEKQYPGINVKYADVKPTQVLQQLQVQEQARNVQIDVAASADQYVPGLLSSNVVDSTINWAADGVSSQALLSNTGLVRDFSLGDFIVYNKNKVAASDAPKTWDDLLNPQWKGKLALDGRGGFLGVYYVDPKLGASNGLDLAKKLTAQQPSYQANLEEVIPLVSSGQDLIGTAQMGQTLTAIAKGAPIAIAPVSPIETSSHLLYVPRSAPHAAAGELVISWLESPAGQAAYAHAEDALLPSTTACPTTSGNPLGTALCQNNIEWMAPTEISQFKPLNDYTQQISKIFGTFTGN